MMIYSVKVIYFFMGRLALDFDFIIIEVGNIEKFSIGDSGGTELNEYFEFVIMMDSILG